MFGWKRRLRLTPADKLGGILLAVSAAHLKVTSAPSRREPDVTFNNFEIRDELSPPPPSSSLTGWVGEGPVTKWRGGVKAEVGTETSYWMCWRLRQTYEVWCQVISGCNHHYQRWAAAVSPAWAVRRRRTTWPVPTAGGTVRGPACNNWRCWRRNSGIKWLHFRLQSSPPTSLKLASERQWPANTNMDTSSTFSFVGLFQDVSVHAE